MSTKTIYAISGLLVGAAVNIGINLLSAAIQQRAFSFFSDQVIWGLVVFIVLGLLIGYWLGGQLQVPTSTTSKKPTPGQPDTITITRLRALLSYGKLKGKGIHLKDILLIGSRIDIET